MGNVIDSFVERLFLKDDCDGSGLNNSENSKVSRFFFNDIVQTFIKVPWSPIKRD